MGALIIGPRLANMLAVKLTPCQARPCPWQPWGRSSSGLVGLALMAVLNWRFGHRADANAIANIYANTFIAAAAGCVMAMLTSQLMFGKVDLTLALNGVIGGLVSITAGPEYTNLLWPILIGAIGGLLIPLSVQALDAMKVDDVVGAIPAHLVCGIWGTLAVGIFYPL